MHGSSSGWFLLLISIIGFIRVKRYERSILRSRNSSADHAPSAPQPQPTVEDITRDLLLRRNLEEVFGIPMVDSTPTSSRHRSQQSESDARRETEEERMERRLTVLMRERERERRQGGQRELDAGEARVFGRLQEEARLQRDLREAGLL